MSEVWNFTDEILVKGLEERMQERKDISIRVEIIRVMDEVASSSVEGINQVIGVPREAPPDSS